MPSLYQLAILGAPSAAQISELENIVSQAVSMFNLRLGHEVGWDVCPKSFEPHQQRSAAAVFFGGENAPLANVAKLLERGIPLLPVASDVSRVNVEIPAMMQPLNCLAVASRTIIWPLVKQIRPFLVPLLDGLHRRLAAQC